MPEAHGMFLLTRTGLALLTRLVSAEIERAAWAVTHTGWLGRFPQENHRVSVWRALRDHRILPFFPLYQWLTYRGTHTHTHKITSVSAFLTDMLNILMQVVHAPSLQRPCVITSLMDGFCSLIGQLCKSNPYLMWPPFWYLDLGHVGVCGTGEEYQLWSDTNVRLYSVLLFTSCVIVILWMAGAPTAGTYRFLGRRWSYMVILVCVLLWILWFWTHVNKSVSSLMKWKI